MLPATKPMDYTTEEEIDTAIKELGATIQKKADQREEANQKLRESRDQHTEKQANHRNCQNRQAECGKNFEERALLTLRS